MKLLVGTDIELVSRFKRLLQPKGSLLINFFLKVNMIMLLVKVSQNNP